MVTSFDVIWCRDIILRRHMKPHNHTILSHATSPRAPNFGGVRTWVEDFGTSNVRKWLKPPTCAGNAQDVNIHRHSHSKISHDLTNQRLSFSPTGGPQQYHFKENYFFYLVTLTFDLDHQICPRYWPDAYPYWILWLYVNGLAVRVLTDRLTDIQDQSPAVDPWSNTIAMEITSSHNPSLGCSYTLTESESSLT